MQYYQNGFFPGDPRRQPSEFTELQRNLPAEVDVLIVGTGPAGLTLAASLAQFPSITTRIIERREGPLELGQADGVACRTVETFETFGLARQLLEEAYWVNETSFWRPDGNNRDRIVRTGRIQDVEDGLSEFPHVIVNQARVHDFLLGAMRDSSTRLAPTYGTEFLTLTVEPEQPYPVQVRVQDAVATREIRARYVVGCDGARSAVRRSIGRELRGERANHAWGVMDVLAVTDFPDIRLKAAIQSTVGSILLIPREGGYLVRLYVDLGSVTEDNRTRIRGMNAEQIIAVAQDVLRPYTLDVREVAWWSIYEVAQRVTDAFDDAREDDQHPHVFIAGDACHTHSAKAGQGMNVSIQDAFNLGWKLAAVLRGYADVGLLATYSMERQPVAEQLIAFDREWSALLAAAPADPEHPERGGTTPEQVQAYFAKHGRYTAGFGTTYTRSRLTSGTDAQHLATGLEVGTRFHSAPVTRISDAMELQLGHVHRADGRFRLYLFADANETQFQHTLEWLAADPGSPVHTHTGSAGSLIDVLGIVQRPHREVVWSGLPELLRPITGKLGLCDYEKAFSARSRAGDFYDTRGIDRERGVAVAVRPDQYIGTVLPLADVDGITVYFATALRSNSAQ